MKHMLHSILEVDLGDRSYPIYIGRNLLSSSELLGPHVQGRRVIVVSNETIAPLYLDRVMAGLKELKTACHLLPDGERYKDITHWSAILDTMLAEQLDRHSIVIALGGGVVGDMAGFAAACYQRGVKFIQIPTTLLAQVDSSVGGKTGINHPQGKNMIGAFHQPQCVIADTDVLATLDDRQLSAGLAEVIKYGLIRDHEFFTWLETHLGELLDRNPETLAQAIETSCRCKAEIVAADEHEQGLRALLNLGHTFGHAIETGMGYGQWLHGEAVAAGMVMAAGLSHRLGWIEAEDVARTTRLIKAAHLPVMPPADLSADRFLELMSIDKKARNGQLVLVLLQKIGQGVVTKECDHEVLRDFLIQTPRQ